MLSYAELIRDRYPDDGEIRLFTAAILSARTGWVDWSARSATFHACTANQPQPRPRCLGCRPSHPSRRAGRGLGRAIADRRGVVLSVREALSILRFDPLIACATSAGS